MKRVAYEGPTACGKTTLMNEMERRLSNRGIIVGVVSERNVIRNLVDRLQVGDIIRSELPPITESLFWLMNQAFRVEAELPLRQEEMVFLDRYYHTPIVYQYLALQHLGVSLEDVCRYIIAPFGLRFPSPDLTIALTAPFPVLATRFKQREGREMSHREHELTLAAQDIYTRLGSFFDNYFILHSDRPVESICNDVELLMSQKGLL